MGGVAAGLTIQPCFDPPDHSRLADVGDDRSIERVVTNCFPAFSKSPGQRPPVPKKRYALGDERLCFFESSPGAVAYPVAFVSY